MKTAHRMFPWGVLILAIVYLASQFTPNTPDSPYDLGAFGRIPVSAEGRVKPLDSLARTNLLLISGKQSVRDGTVRTDAISWLADVMFAPERAQHHKVFRIDHPDLRSRVGLTDEDGRMTSFGELFPFIAEIQNQAAQAAETPARERSHFSRAALQLHSRLSRYMELSRGFHPYGIAPLAGETDWTPVAMRMNTGIDAESTHPSIRAWSRMHTTYRSADAQSFNQEVAAYLDIIARDLPKDARRASTEVVYNRVQPFMHGIVLYVFAFILACTAFLLDSNNSQGSAKSAGRAAMWVILLAFAVHTLGLAVRIYLQGRPPVTNLYSSAIFVGWGTVAAGVVIERLIPLRIAAIASAVVGFTTLIVAHNLSDGSDTMQMMQAVLDSNFWLTTHVIAITLGYSATYLAGFMAAMFILLGVCTRTLTKEKRKDFGRMVYGVVCFALLLSFVGTVLGGIWADQSWGRFWGWDPKENGAMLIVLMNALILHARWGGLIRERGLMILVVSGNIVTTWSWFGTNMLGVGLHAYGFIDSAVLWMLVFIASQLLLMLLGGIPMRYWKSTKNTA